MIIDAVKERYAAENTGPSSCAAAHRAHERIPFVRVGGSDCVRCGRSSHHRRVSLLTLLAIALFRRLVPHQSMARHDDVAGFVYETVGVTYAAVLAFIVIATWENYAEISGKADQEGSSLGALYQMANGFPKPPPGGGAGGGAGLRRNRG